MDNAQPQPQPTPAPVEGNLDDQPTDDVVANGDSAAQPPDVATPSETTPPEPTQEDNESADNDPFAGLDDVASMDLYDISNYTFGKKNQESVSKVMQQMADKQLSDTLRDNYNERGMRRSVGGILLVHEHNFPHILLLQRSDGKGQYALPGGRLRPGESDEEGLRRKLISKLQPDGNTSGEEEHQLEIGEKSTICSCSLLKPCVEARACAHVAVCVTHLLTNYSSVIWCLWQCAAGMRLTFQDNTIHTFRRT